MDELTEVLEILANGDRVALKSGTMYTIYRVRHNEVSGETWFEYEGLAALTGQHNTLRWHSRAPSAPEQS